MSEPSEERIATFIESARRYCLLIEAVGELGRGAFVWDAGDRIASLYAAAVGLPSGQPDRDTGGDRALSDSESIAIWQHLREVLGDVDAYHLVYDPYDLEDAATPVVATLSDDLSDIYRDIKDVLATAATRASPADAIWKWRFEFEHHWGVHASAALHAIHWITHRSGSRWVSPDDP